MKTTKADTIYIVPAEGMTIPHPDDNSPVGAEGAVVPNNRFYRNFLNRNEASKGQPPKPAKPATPAQAAQAAKTSTDKE